MKIFKESPTVYVERILSHDTMELIKGYARDGLSLSEIADKIEVPFSVFSRARYENKELWDAIQSNRDLTNYKVENALLKAALGYRTKEVKVTTVIQRGVIVETVKEETDKEVHPNIIAAQTWLYNKLPDKWKKNRDKILDLEDEDNHIQISITKPSEKVHDTKVEKEKINSEVDYSIKELNNAEVNLEEASEEVREEWEEWLKKDNISQSKDTKVKKPKGRPKKKDTIIPSRKEPTAKMIKARSEKLIDVNQPMYKENQWNINLIELEEKDEFTDGDWDNYINQTKDSPEKIKVKSKSLAKKQKEQKRTIIVNPKTKDNSNEEWDAVL